MFRFDIEDAFQKIGRVSDVWVARKPPGFAFIEMEVNVEAYLNILSNRTKHLNEHSTFKKISLFRNFLQFAFPAVFISGQKGCRGCLQGA